MLDTIREKTQGLLATIVLLLIGIPFALWGISNYFEGGSALKVAKVDGVDISVEAYRNTLEQQRQYMYQMLGKNADGRMFDNPVFKMRVVEGLITQELVSQQAQDYGYRVGNEQLAQAIQNVPQFLDHNGKFDPKVYQEVLRNARTTPSGYEHSLREDLLAEQVRSGFGQAVVAPADVDQLLRLQLQQRTLAFAVIGPEQFKNAIKVSEDLIKDYYATHADEFKVPAQVRVEYIQLSASDLAKDLSFTEDELRKQYEDDAARYVIPEERRASHILVAVPAGAKDEDAKRAFAKAEELRKQVLAGADFATLARKASQDPASAAKGGDLGYVRHGNYVKEFDAALFSMKQGEVSQPIKTQYGYHLIKLTGVKPEVRKPFAQVRGELEATLRAHKGEERFYEAGQNFQNLVYEHPEGLQAAAEALHLRIMQSDWFSHAGGPGVASNPKLVEAAFSPDVLSQQRNSDAIETGPSTLVALHVSARQAERTRPLEEVHTAIVARLQAQGAEQEAAKAGAALRANVDKGQEFVAAARAAGAKYTSDKTITRNKAEGVDRRLVDAAFKANQPQGKPVYGSVDLGKDGYAIFALKGVTDGDPKQADASQRQQVKQLLERRRGDEFFDAYIAGLRKTKPIKIFQDQL